jgi:EpsI family protein
VCYPAQGFQIIANQTGVVDTATHPLRVRQLVARAGSRTEPISYWMTVGDRTALSGTEQKLAQLSYSARGIIPDGMLVRVSNIDNNAAAGYALHADFIAQMTRAMPIMVRDRIVGAAEA